MSSIGSWSDAAVRAALGHPLASPATLAEHASEGLWIPHPHLLRIDRALLGVAAGTVKRLMILMPPRHGKSELISKYFPSWALLTNPHLKVLLTSYEADFAAKWGRGVRDTVEDVGWDLSRVRVRQDSSAAHRWGIRGTMGEMNTAGAGGPITGKGADIFVIDDPVKNWDEAESEVYREKIWEWYRSTARTRLQKNAAIVVIMTRWHPEDLAGKLLEADKGRGKWTVIRMPAIADEVEDAPGWHRDIGQPLCEGLMPADQLRELEVDVGDRVWAGLYQQQPFRRGGGAFKIAAAPLLKTEPHLIYKIRAWDLAATTKKRSKRTAGVLFGRGVEDKKWFVLDVVCGKWTPDDRNAIILATAAQDGEDVQIVIEQEPGSSGLEQAASMTDLLAGYAVEPIAVSGDKDLRADAVSAQWNAGRVSYLASGWNAKFLAELESFPNGTYKDQVDALSLAFNEMWKRGVPDDGDDTPKKCECGRDPHDPWCEDRFPKREADADR